MPKTASNDIGTRVCPSRRPVLAWALLLSIALTGVARAQTQLDNYQRQLDLLRRQQLLQANPDVPADQRAFLDYGAYLTLNYLTVDDNRNENHVLRQYDFIAYTRLNIDSVHEFFLRFRTAYRDFNDQDSFDGRGDELIDPDIDLGYYRFDLARYLGTTKQTEIDGDVTLEVGRDIVYWGNGLTMGQVIDGAFITLTKGPVKVDAIAGVTPIRTVDFDASRPKFDFHTRRGFYGLMASTQVGTHRPFAYALLQQDYNNDDPFILGSVTTRFGYDSYYLGLGSTGSIGDHINYGAELVYEGGRSRSNSFVVSGPFLSPVDQTTDDISAYAADLRADYLMLDPRRSRISGEVLLASGDDDRLQTSNTFGGNSPGTTDKAFNGFGLINTGQAFAATISNLMMYRVGASTFPFPDYRPLRDLQIGTDVFFYGKFDQNAPIDEPTNNGRYLGWEPDIYLNWPITSDVTLAVRYGIFFPSDNAFGNDDTRQFFSTSVTFAF